MRPPEPGPSPAKPNIADRNRCAAPRISGAALLPPSARTGIPPPIFVPLPVPGCSANNTDFPRESLHCQSKPTFARHRRWHKYVEGFLHARTCEPTLLYPETDCIAHSVGMGISSAEKPPLSSRRPQKRREVAAVCYRIRKGDIEFLLVQTRSGRWTFPKGGVEADLTQAQSAALEAVEEAGVHGRIEEVPFARYFRKHQDHTPVKSMRAEAPSDLAVAAHLCEVFRQETPQEPGRNPTWFNPEKTKQRLRKYRTPEFGAELARVVERAQSRIERLRHGQDIPSRTNTNTNKDGLQEVRFEARTFAVHARPRSVLRISPEAMPRPVLQLGAGADSAPEIVRKTVTRITAIDARRIDSRRKANFPTACNLPVSARRVSRTRS